MKQIILALLCGLLMLCAGCSGRQELPTEIAEVGDVLVKQEDALLPSSPLTGFASAPTAAEAVNTVTSDMVCSWFHDVISEEFTELPAEDGCSIHAASLTDGGSIEVMNYYGSYYSTTFLYSVETDSDTMLNSAVGNLELYLARKLTDTEREELRQAAEAVLLGSEMQHIRALSEFVRVTLFSENDKIHIQCS